MQGFPAVPSSVGSKGSRRTGGAVGGMSTCRERGLVRRIRGKSRDRDGPVVRGRPHGRRPQAGAGRLCDIAATGRYDERAGAFVMLARSQLGLFRPVTKGAGAAGKGSCSSATRGYPPSGGRPRLQRPGRDGARAGWQPERLGRVGKRPWSDPRLRLAQGEGLRGT